MCKLTGLLLSAVLTMAGCQATGAKPTATTLPSDDRAIASVTSQGTVVYLAGHGTEVKTLLASGTTACAQCKTDAANYFATGMVTEKCSVCSAARHPLMHAK